MQNKLKLSALDGCVVIDGDTVSIVADEETSIQVNMEEWKTLREELRLDDTVDYGRGETPLTVYQFNSFVELTRKIKILETEKERLLDENKMLRKS
jgi:hypothetical protein